MSNQKAEPKVLTPEEKKLKEHKQKKSGEIVCSVMMMFMGVITSPKLLGHLYQKQLFPADYQLPGFYAYLACTGGFIFILTAIITLMRIFGKRPTPAKFQDPAQIISMNEAMKNTIIYNLIFLGFYYYLSKNWKDGSIRLDISPFILLGLLIFDFFMRLLEFLIGAKGFRYLPQAIILFFLTVLSLECFAVASSS